MASNYLITHAGVGFHRQGDVVKGDLFKDVDTQRLIRLGAIVETTADPTVDGSGTLWTPATVDRLATGYPTATALATDALASVAGDTATADARLAELDALRTQNATLQAQLQAQLAAAQQADADAGKTVTPPDDKGKGK